MNQNTKKYDPLDGFRARTDDDDANEEIVRGIRGLSEMGIDHALIADIVSSRDLRHALTEDKVLSKLVDHAVKIIQNNSLAWTESNEPEKLKREHLEARAAHIILTWAEAIIQSGKVAEQQVAEQETSNE